MSELIAYHEAGHALMAVLLGGKVKQVTIEPDDDDGPDRQGDTQVLWRRSRISNDEFAKIAVQVSLAGPVAEMIYSGDPYHPGLVAEWASNSLAFSRPNYVATKLAYPLVRCFQKKFARDSAAAMLKAISSDFQP